MERLRAPDGCPWDREQTPATLKPYVIEEAYEVCDAIESGDPQKLREELGDLLLQVVFQAQIAREAGQFDLNDVVNAISDKMERRHPHVFGGTKLDTAAEVMEQWELRKANEKGRDGMLDGIPKALPALRKARRVTEKAALIGFDWPNAGGVYEKLDEELAELKAATASGDARAIEDELGDVLFTVVNLARHLGPDPEDALIGALAKFMRRFRAVELALREQGVAAGEAGLPLLEALWNEAKASDAG